MPAGNMRVFVVGRIGPGILVSSLEILASRVDLRLKDGAVDIYQDNPSHMLTVNLPNLSSVELDFETGILAIGS